MVVARIGVAAVAVLAAEGERLLVVALDREHASLGEEGPDLFGVGPEAAEVAQAVDGLGAAAAGVLQQRGQGKVVVVDAAEDGDPGVGALDGNRILRAGSVGAQRRRALLRGEAQARAGGGLAEQGEGHQLLAPGGHAAVSGQLGPGVAFLLGDIPGRPVGHGVAFPQVRQLTP